jgi:hypothetical protein
VTRHEHEEDPHVGRAGGAGGAASPSAPEDASGRDDEESTGAGDIEVPLGLPVSEEEFRRLKEAARSPGRGGADEAADEDRQQDEGRNDSGQESSP